MSLWDRKPSEKSSEEVEALLKVLREIPKEQFGVMAREALTKAEADTEKRTSPFKSKPLSLWALLQPLD